MNMRTLQYDLDDYLDLLRQRAAMGVDVHAQLSEAESKVESSLILTLLSSRLNPHLPPTEP